MKTCQICRKKRQKAVNILFGKWICECCLSNEQNKIAEMGRSHRDDPKWIERADFRAGRTVGGECLFDKCKRIERASAEIGLYIRPEERQKTQKLGGILDNPAISIAFKKKPVQGALAQWPAFKWNPEHAYHGNYWNYYGITASKPTALKNYYARRAKSDHSEFYTWLNGKLKVFSFDDRDKTLGMHGFEHVRFDENVRKRGLSWKYPKSLTPLLQASFFNPKLGVAWEYVETGEQVNMSRMAFFEWRWSIRRLDGAEYRWPVDLLTLTEGKRLPAFSYETDCTTTAHLHKMPVGKPKICKQSRPWARVLYRAIPLYKDYLRDFEYTPGQVISMPRWYAAVFYDPKFRGDRAREDIENLQTDPYWRELVTFKTRDWWKPVFGCQVKDCRKCKYFEVCFDLVADTLTWTVNPVGVTPYPISSNATHCDEWEPKNSTYSKIKFLSKLFVSIPQAMEYAGYTSYNTMQRAFFMKALMKMFHYKQAKGGRLILDLLDISEAKKTWSDYNRELIIAVRKNYKDARIDYYRQIERARPGHQVVALDSRRSGDSANDQFTLQDVIAGREPSAEKILMLTDFGKTLPDHVRERTFPKLLDAARGGMIKWVDLGLPRDTIKKHSQIIRRAWIKYFGKPRKAKTWELGHYLPDVFPTRKFRPGDRVVLLEIFEPGLVCKKQKGESICGPYLVSLTGKGCLPVTARPIRVEKWTENNRFIVKEPGKTRTDHQIVLESEYRGWVIANWLRIELYEVLDCLIPL